MEASELATKGDPAAAPALPGDAHCGHRPPAGSPPRARLCGCEQSRPEEKRRVSGRALGGTHRTRQHSRCRTPLPQGPRPGEQRDAHAGLGTGPHGRDAVQEGHAERPGPAGGQADRHGKDQQGRLPRAKDQQRHAVPKALARCSPAGMGEAPRPAAGRSLRHLQGWQQAEPTTEQPAADVARGQLPAQQLPQLPEGNRAPGAVARRSHPTDQQANEANR